MSGFAGFGQPSVKIRYAVLRRPAMLATVPHMNLNLDLGLGDLTDEALRAEIELIGELVVAASACPGRMGLAELDSILGVRR